MENVTQQLVSFILQIETSLGLPKHMLLQILLICAIYLLARILGWVANQIIIELITRAIKKTKNKWDDHLLKHRVFNPIGRLIPPAVVYEASKYILPSFPTLGIWVRKLTLIAIAFIALSFINRVINTFVDICKKSKVFKNKPINSYAQIIKIISILTTIIISIAILIGKSPLYLLSGLGALTAVLLLIFKDAILGFVASIQIAANDMVRIGDWIEMTKFGADGDVIDVSLTTIKVQNWDKTISYIPVQAILSNSFKNWRGMQESGGRRIKRSINIDMTTVRFLTKKDIESLKKVHLLEAYLKAKEEEIKKHNEKNKLSQTDTKNSRQLTNLGTFRAYLSEYLKKNPNISKDLTFLIRQLQPTAEGLPIEIYVFSNDQVWANYEAIQSDIFDHILATLPLFDLKIFQLPSNIHINT